jgi:hypothetical protein
VGITEVRQRGEPGTRILFTLKDPHNFPVRIFGLRAEMKDRAIVCDSSRGPCFDDDDIYVSDNCNASIRYRDLGGSYANDTDNGSSLAGWAFFTAKGIKVFEIRD